MANHASHGALPYPIKNARYTVLVPLLDADGDPTAQTTPDTEISEDNAAATDAAEEVSATSGMDGMGMLTLTGAETDCSTLAANFKAASGPKATLMTLYPRVLAVVGSGTLSAGSAGGGTLGTLLPYDITGCFIKTTGGTGGGGTGGASNQARKIITYNTATGAFTVAPNWETTPSTDTTYEVLLPEGITLGMLKVISPGAFGVHFGTAQAGAAGTVTLATSASATADFYKGGTALIVGGTGVGQARFIYAYSTGRVASISPNWSTTPDSTSQIIVLPSAPFPTQAGQYPGVDVKEWLATAVGAPNTAGVPIVDTVRVANTVQTGADIGSLVAKFTGITRLSHWLGAIAGKQAADATAQTEIRASGAGSGAYDPATDSNEALRDRGDAAWVTATGFATSAALTTLAGTIATLDAFLLKVRRYFMLALRKDAAIATDAATEKTELNADLGSGAGSFDQTTDSGQGIRDSTLNADAKAVNGVTLQGAGTSGDPWRPA